MLFIIFHSKTTPSHTTLNRSKHCPTYTRITYKIHLYSQFLVVKNCLKKLLLCLFTNLIFPPSLVNVPAIIKINYMNTQMHFYQTPNNNDSKQHSVCKCLSVSVSVWIDVYSRRTNYERARTLTHWNELRHKILFFWG